MLTEPLFGIYSYVQPGAQNRKYSGGLGGALAPKKIFWGLTFLTWGGAGFARGAPDHFGMPGGGGEIHFALRLSQLLFTLNAIYIFLLYIFPPKPFLGKKKKL